MNKRNNMIYIVSILLIALISFILINNINNSNKYNLKEITYKDIIKKTDNKDSFVLVISRTTCSHCVDYKPKLKSITAKHNIDIYYIDYDNETKKNQERLFNQFDLDGSTPITLFIKKGKQTNIFDRIEGDVSENQVIKKLKDLKYIK